MNKTLSIAIPSYNVERYLFDSLSSYIQGTPDERLEVIVVNDGSTDQTQTIAQEFCDRYPTVFKLVTKENGGHGSAINAGIAAASGRYFRVIDGDDRICTTHISALLDALDAASEDLVVDVKNEVSFETGESTRFPLPDDIPTQQTCAFADVCLRDDIEGFFFIHSLSIRTDYLRQHGVSLLEHTFYVDYEFIVKVAAYAQTIRFLDIDVCRYYVGNAEQSVAPANYVRRWGDHTRVTCELLQFARDKRLDPTRQLFVNERVRLLINTHYTIALIYDQNKQQGRCRAAEFRAYLKEEHYSFYMSTEQRYWTALTLNRVGIDARRLNKLLGRG